MFDPKPFVAGLPEPARRVPDAGGRRRGALRRQGRRPEEARRLLLPEAGPQPAHPHDGVPGGRHRGHGDALRRRGAAAREQPDQEPRAALQHPVPRRQVLSLPDGHRARLPAPGLSPRREGPAQPPFRPVPARARGAREHPAAAARVPAAHLRGLGVPEPLAALPAAPDPALHRALHRPDLRRALCRGRAQRRAVPGRPRGRRDAACWASAWRPPPPRSATRRPRCFATRCARCRACRRGSTSSPTAASTPTWWSACRRTAWPAST